MPDCASFPMVVDRQRWFDRSLNANRQLIKGVWKDPVRLGTIFYLLDPMGKILDEESVHVDSEFPWPFGFWVPELILIERTPLRLMLKDAETMNLFLVHYGEVSEGALPLHLYDDFHASVCAQEKENDTWPGVKKNISVPDYLSRHDLIYEKPADHWTDGLCIGNGIVGGVITGEPNGTFHVGLDHAEIWFADQNDRPLGRGYAADVTIDYPVEKGETFFQRLSLGEAMVKTSHGKFAVDAFVEKNSSVCVIEVRAKRSMEISFTLHRKELPLLSDCLAAMWNKSWIRIAASEDIKAFEECLQTSQRAEMIIQVHSGTGVSLICRAPNLSVVTTMTIPTENVQILEQGATVRCNVLAGKGIRVLTSIGVCRPGEERTCWENNLRKTDLICCGKVTSTAHKTAWEYFWNRSFVQLDNPIQEKLYYLGLYQVASSFGGNRAASFFGLSQPVDHRTWLDAHVTDAQTQMLTWCAHPSNHPELAAPFLNTYAGVWKEHAEHNYTTGSKAPHWFHPMEGGGHASLAHPKKHPYPFGSPAWHTLDFWTHFLYTGDREFLKLIAYPILRSTADAILQTMTFKDGTYHCFNSASAEQSHTDHDNVYDRVCVEALFKATIQASECLDVDVEERKQFSHALEHLFHLPTNGKTIFETMENHHPYRCHPVVLMGLYPLALWKEGSTEYELAKRTFDVVTNLFGFHYEDRHLPICGYEGGIEPNGHATSFLLAFSARLKRRDAFDRLFNTLVLGRQLKRNGLRAISDPRHSAKLERMGILEASSGQSAAILELLVQSYSNQIEIFPGVQADKSMRFAGLRAMGGFIVSGEWTGKEIVFIAIKSNSGNDLQVAAPWKKDIPVLLKRIYNRKVLIESNPVFPLPTWPGEILIFSQEKKYLTQQVWKMDRKIAKKPTAIPLDVTDPHTAEVVFYPEDPPFAQDVENGYIFLGNPAKFELKCTPVWDKGIAIKHILHQDDRLRQTAARVLRRYPDAESRRVLADLTADKSVIVAATALVSLALHNTKPSDILLQSILRKIDNPYLKREAEKALNRRKC